MNDGEEVMPSFWSANYFSLTHGKSITASSDLMKGKTKEIQLKGLNIDKLRIALN